MTVVFGFAVLCLAASAATYVPVLHIGCLSGYSAILAALVAAPFVMLDTSVLQWVRRAIVGNELSLLFYFLVALYVLAGGVTLRFFHRHRFDSWPGRRLLALAGVVICVPLTFSFRPAHALSTARGSVFAAPKKLNHLLLITVDTLRQDALSTYGSPIPTPHLDRLAQDGIVFAQAYSTSPWTKPSLVSILTGTSPWVHKVRTVSHGIPEGLPTLAEFFRDAGYLTAAVGSNHVLTPSKTDRSMTRGFLAYDFYPKHKTNAPTALGAALGLELLPKTSGAKASTDDLTRMAVEWIRSHRREDFFLWLHYYDPHGPYEPPAEFRPDRGRPGSFRAKKGRNPATPSAGRNRVKALYDAEVSYVDDRIGKLTQVLKQLDLYEPMLIIFTSDHGEEFWEHGGVDHGHTLFNELLEVPLIVKLSGSSKSLTVNQPVSAVSLLPTILDLAGISYHSQNFSGRSLRPLWERGDDGDEQGFAFSTALWTQENQESVIFDSHKYIEWRNSNRAKLFDLKRDPGETADLADRLPQTVRKGQALLAAHRFESAKLRRLHGIEGPQEFELDEDTRRALKSLGYIK